MTRLPLIGPFIVFMFEMWVTVSMATSAGQTEVLHGREAVKETRDQNLEVFHQFYCKFCDNWCLQQKTSMMKRRTLHGVRCRSTWGQTDMWLVSICLLDPHDGFRDRRSVKK